MRQKQLKKMIIIIVSLVLVVGLVFTGVFFFGDSLGGSGNDIEIKKAEGNYELLKSDLISVLKTRDSQAATIADILFEKVKITSYEGLEQGGKKGNTWIYADGYRLDSFLRAGVLLNIYIGNVLIYKNDKEFNTTVANVTEYTYPQYNNLVDAFKKGTSVEMNVAQSLFESMTNMGITNMTNVKKGKLNGESGFIGKEGEMSYFFKLSGDQFKEIYVTYGDDEFVKVYDMLTSDGVTDIKEVKIISGKRQGIANVLSYRVKQLTELEVIFPAALLNGDDSWLMVQNNDEIYIAVRAEVKEKEKSKSKDFVIRLQSDTNDILYLKIGNKVYKE